MSKNVKPSLSYKDVDWAGFESIPSEDVYEDWRAERKRKHSVGVTQSAMNLIRPHINQLARYGVEADTAFAIGASLGWRGIRYSWVVKELQADMDAFTEGRLISEQPKSTREMTIAQELDRDWAKH